MTPQQAAVEQWQPIETAPKDNTPFLGWCPDETAPHGGDIRICWWEPKIDGGCWYGDRDLPERPTLWQPAPAIPVANARSMGTSACPICGFDQPHNHSPEEIAAWRARGEA